MKNANPSEFRSHKLSIMLNTSSVQHGYSMPLAVETTNP